MGQILVVEDEEHIQRLVRLILEKQGHEVWTASSGEEALGRLQEGLKPQLILLDIMMPGIDGLQVLRKIKQQRAIAEIPVVMLTALAQENMVIQGVKLGARDYIRKPFHPRELLKRLAPLLGSVEACG